jgi:2,4-dienoyl-CoA reductase-like NADH-dependent reductase (Old Yellow Enzyme family)
MPAKLFTPFDLGALHLANRIVIAPKCTYSATDGCANDWHVIHYGGLALSGAGLLTIEATAVAPEGRITYGDIGLWNDNCEAALGAQVKAAPQYLRSAPRGAPDLFKA